MSKAKALIGLIGIIILVWGIGTATRIWANPIFAPFWIISNGMAEVLSYVGTFIGGLLLALAVIVYYPNTNRKIAKTGTVSASQTMQPISKALVLLGLGGIGFLVWSIGVATRLWGNPIFAYFWFASNDAAHALSYVGTGIGALLLALAVLFYYQNTSGRTGKIFGDGSSQKFKPAVPEFYDDSWQKKLLQQTEADTVKYPPFIIINGRRTYLGFEEMEKIVD